MESKSVYSKEKKDRGEKRLHVIVNFCFFSNTSSYLLWTDIFKRMNIPKKPPLAVYNVI